MSGVAEEMAPKAAFDAPVSRGDRTLIAYILSTALPDFICFFLTWPPFPEACFPALSFAFFSVPILFSCFSLSFCLQFFVRLVLA